MSRFRLWRVLDCHLTDDRSAIANGKWRHRSTSELQLQDPEATISTGIEKGCVARFLNLVWSAILIGLMATGTLSTAHIGAITWGPQHDIWSAAIAISQIKFGLTGALAYREIEQAIADEVTSTKSVWNVEDAATRSLNNDPAAVTRGFHAAAAVQQERLAIPPTRDGYVSDWAEDIGYADFYNLAFRIFGFNAYATHWLYFSLLSATLVLFALAFMKESAAIGSLTSSVTALFALSCSSFFSAAVPSFAANRFVSTLALIPLLHIVNTVLRRFPLARWEVVCLAAQSLIMSFAIASRSSTMWCLIAVGICGLAVLVVRSSAKHAAAAPMMRFDSIHAGRILVSTAIVAAVFATSAVIRSERIDARYYQDDNYPHHLVWHSAYLGLTVNPDWATKRPPYADVRADGDGAGFELFKHSMAEQGLPAASTDNEVYHQYYPRTRAYEAFIRHEYLHFLVQNPVYGAELFAYYKPARLFEWIFVLVGTIPNIAWLLIACSIALTSFCISVGRTTIRPSELVLCFGIIWLSSLFPVFWAYPARHVIADQVWSSLFLALFAISALVPRAAAVALRPSLVRFFAVPHSTGR